MNPPEFVIRATDRFALATVANYRRTCLAHGLPEQAEEVMKALLEISAWQDANLDRVLLPNQKHVPMDERPRLLLIGEGDELGHQSIAHGVEWYVNGVRAKLFWKPLDE